MKESWDLSLRPYLINAFYAWCESESFSCYVVVKVDENCVVPSGYTDDSGNITLNISLGAVVDLAIDNSLSFKARFSGKEESIYAPIGNVLAVYAPETNFEAALPFAFIEVEKSKMLQSIEDKKPSLKIIK